MSSGFLTRHFDRLFDEPDTVQQLRRLILDLAIRGRLVHQDPSDQSARALLTSLLGQQASRRANHQGTVEEAIIPSAKAPFPIPKTWVWTRLGYVVRKLTDGTHHSPPSQAAGLFKYITAKNIKSAGVDLTDVTYVSKEVHDEIYARCNPELGDVLYIKDGATTGVVTINDLDEPFSMLSSVALLKLPEGVFNRLLVTFLRSPFFYDQMRGYMKGSALPRVTLTRMIPALLPLPPLAEQHRIVAQVDELMTMCTELEAALLLRERRRDTTGRATLSRMAELDDREDPHGKTSRHATMLYLANSHRLITRPQHIAALRQTILDLAVKGKLVPQDTTEEPASTLIAAADAIRAAQEGRNARAPAAAHESRPVALPVGWEFTDMNRCFRVVGGIQKQPKRAPQANAFPYLSVANVQRGRLDLTRVSSFELFPGELERLRLQPGDLLIVEGNGSADEIGRCARWSGEISDCVHQNHIIRCRPLIPEMDAFALLYLNSPSGTQTMRTLAVTSAGLYNLSVGKIKQITIPLPPLAEQHRIVAKVDELMKACSDLETSLTALQARRADVLEATLVECLTTWSDGLPPALTA